MNVREVEVGERYYVDSAFFFPCRGEPQGYIGSILILRKDDKGIAYLWVDNEPDSLEVPLWKNYYVNRFRHRIKLCNVKETKDSLRLRIQSAEDALKTLEEEHGGAIL